MYDFQFVRIHRVRIRSSTNSRTFAVVKNTTEEITNHMWFMHNQKMALDKNGFLITIQ